VNKADPSGYYAALRISPDASAEEIRLAFVMLKQEYENGGRTPHPRVRAAYEVLKDPGERAAYDAGPPSHNPLKRPDGTSRLESVPLLIGLVGLLIALLVYTLGPTIQVHFTQFQVGDELYWTATSQPFGVIEEYAEEYSFPDGTSMAAYRIRSESGEGPAWYPAKDLHHHTAPR
jgi:hypothetical protein